MQIVPNTSEDTLPAGHSNLQYQEPQPEQDDELLDMDKLTAHISQQWNINKADRVRIEQEMLLSQYAANNQYDTETFHEIQAMGGSQIFVPLTSMQMNAGASWLLSVLAPPGDKAFTIKSTPVPELSEALKGKITEKVKKKIAASAAPPPTPGGMPPGMEMPPGMSPPGMSPPGGMEMPGGPPPPGATPPAGSTPPPIPQKPDGSPVTPDDVTTIAELETEKRVKEFLKESKLRAERMEGLIHDQLLSSDWYETLESFITDLVTFPTAFIKTTYDYQTSMVATTVDGQFTMESEEKLIAKDERVSPFDIYPSPDQKTIHDGSMLERLRLDKSEIYKCIGKPGYSEENILKVLEESSNGNAQFWQSAVDSQRRWQENHSTRFSGDDGNLYGLRFLGYVSIEEMLDWGYSVEDLQSQGFITEPLDENDRPQPIDLYREIDIDAILIGNHVIKAVPNLDPEGKRPYYAASYRNVPGSFWGKSVAMLARPHQRMVNATARALSNNMGIASGPQIVVYTDRLPNGESLQDIRPLKIWQMVSDPAGSNAQPLQFFQPNSNAQELMAVYQYFFDSVGDVTGIPKQAYSSDPTRSMPSANTASGLAMLMETASKQIKQAVKNIDTGVIEPRLKYQYRTNMMDPEVPNRYKGDMQVHAIGAKSVVSKAVENQRRVELLQATSNPMDMAVLGETGRASMLRSIIASYDMSDIVPSEEEMEKKVEEAKGQPKPPSPEEVKLQIEQIRSDVRLKDQEMENQNAEAQRQLDLQIAQLEFEAKKMDLEIAQVQNQQNNDAKTKQIALKEQNANARFKAEAAIKAENGTGI